MKLVLSSRNLPDHDVPALATIANDLGVEGIDLYIGPGHPVNPDNVTAALPDAVRRLAEEGLVVSMVTGAVDLLLPEDPAARPLLEAMDRADVRLLKLGAYTANPVPADYWAEVARIRRALEGWQAQARTRSVRACCQTHAGLFMGLNCAALMHLLSGFEPRWIGACIDPGDMVANGEPFPLGRAMVGEHLAAVGLKDVLLEWQEGHEGGVVTVAEAGSGMVSWPAVFAELVKVRFDGPVSMQAAFGAKSREEFFAALRREAAFFRQARGLASYAPPL